MTFFSSLTEELPAFLTERAAKKPHIRSRSSPSNSGVIPNCSLVGVIWSSLGMRRSGLPARPRTASGSNGASLDVLTNRSSFAEHVSHRAFDRGGARLAARTSSSGARPGSCPVSFGDPLDRLHGDVAFLDTSASTPRHRIGSRRSSIIEWLYGNNTESKSNCSGPEGASTQCECRDRLRRSPWQAPRRGLGPVRRPHHHGANATSHSSGSTRLWSWIRSTCSTPIRGERVFELGGAAWPSRSPVLVVR